MHIVKTDPLVSSRRQKEISRITWEDFHMADMARLVRDVKHPGQKKGNDGCGISPAEALRTMRLQPHRKGKIFPYNSDTVSRRFTDACKFLDIGDLDFHDLRHEAVSRLFEMGRTIPQAAAVSGHRSWQSMQRYTHLRKSGDKYGAWTGWERLRKLLEVDQHIALQRSFQFLAGTEGRRLKHLLDAAVEPLDHAIGLRGRRRGKTVFDAEVRALLVELVLAAGSAHAQAE